MNSGAEVIHNTTSRPAGQASTLTSPAAVISPVSSDATFFLDTVTGMYQEERDASLGSGDSEPLSEHVNTTDCCESQGSSLGGGLDWMRAFITGGLRSSGCCRG